MGTLDPVYDFLIEHGIPPIVAAGVVVIIAIFAVVLWRQIPNMIRAARQTRALNRVQKAGDDNMAIALDVQLELTRMANGLREEMRELDRKLDTCTTHHAEMMSLHADCERKLIRLSNDMEREISTVTRQFEALKAMVKPEM